MVTISVSLPDLSIVLPGYGNTRRRFQRDARKDVLAGRNATERAAGIVLAEAVRTEFVTVFAAALRHRCKTGTEFHALLRR